MTACFSPRLFSQRSPVLLVMVCVLLAGLVLTPAQSAGATTIPTFTIVSVVADQSVTVLTYNFPKNQLFTVRMGPNGTQAVGGTVVDVTNSGAGGSFQATYSIPVNLKGSGDIAIRMDSPAGFYAYNFFTNIASASIYATAVPGSSTASGYRGIPTFVISSIAPDTSVTVLTYHFPSNQVFTVRMGAYGTYGVGGYVVASTNSGAGGSFQETYQIPDALKGSARLAIRMDSPVGYFSYNWFDNNASGATGGVSGTAVTPTSSYVGYPMFNISGVAGGQSVNVLTNNFPPGETFTVRMGAFGTLANGGTVVGTLESGEGGQLTASYNIPEWLKYHGRIAIRMDGSSGRYAYNWFYNNTYGAAAAGATPTPEPTTSFSWSTTEPEETAASGNTPTPTATTTPAYSGIPSFSIKTVARDASVTVLTGLFPPEQTFTVRMGAYGTTAADGIVVGTLESGDGAVQEATYNIPDALKGSAQIAIRMDSPAGFYAFNWFYNASIN